MSGFLIYTPVAAQGKPPSPSLELRAPDKVGVGEPIELTLTVKHASNIAGYETALLFDTTAAEFAGLQQRQNDLAKMGRDVSPLTVVDLPGGVAFGLYSCPVEDCVTRQGDKKGQGARETVRLATVILIANAPGTLVISLDATKFVDAAGDPVEVSISNPALTIQVGSPGEGATYPAPGGMWKLSSTAKQPGPLDLTADGLVTHADAMEVAIEWVLARQGLAPCGSALDPTRDINRDGCIDVADLQIVAAHYSGADAQAAPGPDTANPVDVESAAIAGLTFTVNAVSDGDDASIGNGICATAFNVCTLRAAIQEANAYAGPNTINFNIGGGGVKTIQLKGKLPTLNDATGPTTINGYSQPGSAPNTDALVSNAAIKIQVVGNGEDRHEGLVITSSGNIIRGLALYKLKRAVWLLGSGATNNVLIGNFIGTDAAGSYGAPLLVTAAMGVQVEQGAARNRIGGTSLAERNVISGNGQTGAALWHEQSDANVILNNLVGLNPAGTNRIPNRRHGLDVNFGSASNVIGGTRPGERNVLSGNDFSGIEISHNAGTAQNRVVGNFIGTDATGQNAPAWSYNGYTGVTLEDGVTNNFIADNVIGNNTQGGIQITGLGTQGNQIHDNLIGVSPDGSPIGNAFGVRADGTNNVIGPNNTIAYNQNNGVVIREDDKDFNRITRNSIYSNGALGIELLPSGVTPNDPEDADTGPNENLNFPVLEDATPQQVTGTACAGCVVEIFIADSGANAYGEGKTFVGSAVADGNGNFTAAINGAGDGDYVTATATDGAGNTSEFSRNLHVK